MYLIRDSCAQRVRVHSVRNVCVSVCVHGFVGVVVIVAAGRGRRVAEVGTNRDRVLSPRGRDSGCGRSVHGVCLSHHARNPSVQGSFLWWRSSGRSR